MRTIIKNKNAGMTLAELLVAIGIFLVIIVSVYIFEINVFSYNKSFSSTLKGVQDSQVILKTMLTELREVAPSANGGYALANVGSTTLSFYSDVDNDGFPEQITYSLINQTVYRAMTRPTGSPAVYLASNQSTTTLVTDVRNGSVLPLFEYFDENYTGSSLPLSQPAMATAVRLIKINLSLNADTSTSTLPVTYSTQVNLRNLKNNL